MNVQLAAVFLLITFLNLGYYWQRELLEIAIRQNLGSASRVWDAFEWYAWLAAAPIGLLLTRWFPAVRERRLRNVAGLVAGGIVLCLVIGNLLYLIRIAPNLWEPDARDLRLDLASYAHSQLALLPVNLVTFTGLIMVSFAVDYYFKYRLRVSANHRFELRMARLRSDLAGAQLAALRGQLQPHFLFNAFNAIATLVRQKRNETAIETITELSALLRLAMETTAQAEVPLERELEFIARYLAVERIRFGDKLRIDVSAPPDTLAALVPNLVLQPLVGNAIKHAISMRTTPGTVTVAARRRGDRLEVEVSDDGPGGDQVDDTIVSTGVGLVNTRARLDATYGRDYSLELTPRHGGGMRVRLDIPWRESGASVAARGALP